MVKKLHDMGISEGAPNSATVLRYGGRILAEFLA